MTVQQAIHMTGEIKKHTYTPELLTRWLSELEGMVQTDVFHIHPVDLTQYDYETDKDREMLADYPHDKLYWLYLCAMVDFARGEYSKYQNTMQAFNEAYERFVRAYTRMYNPSEEAI